MAALLVAALSVSMVWADGPILKPGMRVAIIGDSITEQKRYSKYIETYLLVCRPELEAHVLQYGWSGETAPGFAARMEYDLLPFKPDLATTCYGMNDGGYRGYTDMIGNTYRNAMSNILTRIRAAGGVVVVGSPGVVDSRYYPRGNTNAAKAAAESATNNDKLAHLSVIAHDLATANGFPFADVHGSMDKIMQAAKAALGAEYALAPDGIHPGDNGHLIMAYAFLKAMGMDGEIGTFTVPWAGQPTASTGHKIKAFTNGVLEVESRRYPICFPPLMTNGLGVASILPYLPFQQELNRLTLRVTGLPTAQAEVRWGKTARVYTREQLAAGINLAADFTVNPFSEPFSTVFNAVAAKQMFETQMVKVKFVAERAEIAKGADQGTAALQERNALFAEQAAKAKEVRALVQPVQHQIVIRPLAAP